MSRLVRWLLAAAVAAVVLVVGGTWLYINVIRDDPPDRFSVEDFDETGDQAATGATTTTSTPDATSDVDGVYTVADGSEAGYRAREILFGQDATAVGRTNQVTGTMEIAGNVVTAATVTVDMASVESDEDRRDNQFRGRIMDVATFPTSTFELTQPLDLGELPADGELVTVTAQGRLTLRGVTNDVTVTIEARRSGARIEVAGSVPINFDDYAIPDASGGPASVGRSGEVEFLLAFVRA